MAGRVMVLICVDDEIQAGAVLAQARVLGFRDERVRAYETPCDADEVDVQMRRAESGAADWKPIRTP